jgi:hypothetical protein
MTVHADGGGRVVRCRRRVRPEPGDVEFGLEGGAGTRISVVLD